MSEQLSITCINPVQAHQSIQARLWPWIKAMNMAGHKLTVQARIQEDDRSVQQNRYYWAACLKEISDQANVGGQKYAAEAWHELFKRQFLGYEIKKVTVAGSKRKRVIRRLRSTTDLKVRGMSKYLDQVQAFAASDLGVEFTVKDWARWADVDMETGEIIQ